MNNSTLIISIILFLFTACTEDSKQAEEGKQTYEYHLPKGFSLPEIPEDNPMYVDKIALGRKLFFDPILSKDNTVSCASCHAPTKAFSDSVAFSIGAEKDLGDRNAPTLANVAYRSSFFKDGGVPTLELQILGPFDNELEFDLNILDAIEKLKADPDYVREFNKVFGKDPDPFGLTRSIAAYERTLISGDSKYDQFLFDSNVFSDAEIRGMKLFNSERLACSTCHSGNLFTNQGFENNGLYTSYQDTGRARVTLNSSDAGKFVVPTLRNIALTSPYMFDGSLNNLSEVIDHYASGGSKHANKSQFIKGFTISEAEKNDLILFLTTLTDESFVERHKYDNPF